MDGGSVIIPLELSNGSQLLIHAAAVSTVGRNLLAGQPVGPLAFKDAAAVIAGVADDISAQLASLKPTKTTVALGLTLSAETGVLTALLAKATGEADLTITLEWG